ncbi:MAG TPA: hypothetical protein VIP70_13590 [Nitrososphaeraceae archaeon]
MVITKIQTLYSTMKTIDSKKLVGKKVLIPAILGIGVLLSAIFIALPIAYTWAQQQTLTNNTYMREQGTIPQINGSVSVKDNIKTFFKENIKVPFVSAAETAQKQIANGTVLGGHIGVTQGYLTYTYVVVDPAKETMQKVIVDAGNGQVLYTSEGQPMGSFTQLPTFSPLGAGKGHGSFSGPWKGHVPFAGFWHGLFGP